MRITFLLPHISISGGVRIILTYANLLAKKGREVFVVVPDRALMRRHSANTFRLKPRWIKDFQARILRVADFDERNLPGSDVIIATAWQTASWVYKYSEKMGRKFQFIMHDERLYHGNSDDVAKVFRYPLKKIVISHWLQDIMKREFNSEAEVLIVPVDFKLFHPVKVSKDERHVRVLMLYHDFPWKGVEDGFRAFLQAKQEYPNIKLALFGARHRRINLPCDEYYYNMPQEKLASIYSGCDIYLCPSWDEGLGMPSMEAMACKCALVTYDNGGSRDYAIDGQTALVARRRDVSDLTEKLVQMIKDEELRASIAENGYQLIHKLDTWEEQTDKLEKILATSQV